jgi:hypothetical protein
METTAEFIGARHDRALTTPPSRGTGSSADNLVHKRYVETGIFTVLYLAVSIVMVAWLGAVVLPMFLVPLPLGLVLFWETADVLRSDELRALNAR